MDASVTGLRADRAWDLAVLSLAGRSQYGRRSGSDPLGLAGHLERRKRGGDSALCDTLDDLPDLEEGVQGGDGREHREGADPKESEQQAATYAETIKHRGNLSIRLMRPTLSAWFVSKQSAVIGGPVIP
jgi:hypothetical protein